MSSYKWLHLNYWGKKLIQSEATLNDTHRYLLFTKTTFEQRGKLNSIKHKGYAGFVF